MDTNKKTVEELLKELSTDAEKGLTHAQAKERQAQQGPNVVETNVGRSFWQIFLSQFQDPLVYLLIASGVILFFVGERFDSCIIVFILFANAFIGAFQEVKIAMIIDSLQRLRKTNFLVIRQGTRYLVCTTHLVKGDIIILQEGEKIPADAKIIESYGLSTDEAILTGESDRVKKHNGEDVYAGSYVTSGYGKAVVFEIGEKTQLGKIHLTLGTVSTTMPLKKDLERLLRFILMLIIIICVTLFVIGLASGKPFGRVLSVLTALFICVVPQGLPVIMTVVLVSGAYRMAQRSVYARRLPAVEAIGRINVMIIDKTGTLTRNELIALVVTAGDEIFEATGTGYFLEGEVSHQGKTMTECCDYEPLKLMAEAALLLDRSEVSYDTKNKTFNVKGSPIQAAMRIFAQKLGLARNSILEKYKMRYEIPFSSHHQYHAGFLEGDGKAYIFGLGAPEIIMERCSKVDDSQKKNLEALLAKGLRVVAVGYKQFDLSQINKDEKPNFEGLFKDLELLGFYGLQDSLRTDTPAIIKKIQDAGIQVVMATGDNHKTALALGAQSGILKEGDKALEGPEFQKATDKELIPKLADTTIFSRALPDDKLRLVRLFQARGDTVAMVGDGVNDAPALVLAQLGIVMGGAGSDIAKEAADIILLDDSFENVPDGIAQGRHIFTSFKRAILYFSTSNFAEIFIIMFAFIGNYPLPLLASQILWLTIVTDGFLDFALAMEPQEPGVLNPKWLQADDALITPFLIARIFYQVILLGIILLVLFLYFYKADIALTRSLVLATMTVTYMLMALNCRSLTQSVFEMNFFSNRWLAAALGIIAVLLVGVLYAPWGQLVFQTVPLSFYHWRIVAAVSLFIFLIEEGRKLAMRAY